MAKAYNVVGCNAEGLAVAFNNSQKAPLATMLANNSGAITAEAPYRQAGTLTDLRVYVSTNTIATSATTVTLNKNGGSLQNCTVSFAAGVTGYVTDTTHSDTVTAGDAWGFSIATPNTSGSITFQYFAWHYNVSGSMVVRTGMRGFSSNLNSYLPFVGSSAPAATYSTEAAVQMKSLTACTVSKMWAYSSTNTANSTNTITFRQNNANGNCTIPIGSGVTGILEDTTHSDTVAQDDLICSIFVYTGTGSNAFFGYGYDFSSASVQPFFSGHRLNQSTAQGTTNYIQPHGGIFLGTTEALHQHKVLQAGTISRLSVTIATNGVNASTTYRTRLNGANGSMSIPVSSAATGQFQDTSNSDVLAADDLLNYQEVVGAGGTTINADMIGVAFTTDIAAGHPTMRRWGGVPFMGGTGIGQKSSAAGHGREWGMAA